MQNIIFIRLFQHFVFIQASCGEIQIIEFTQLAKKSPLSGPIIVAFRGAALEKDPARTTVGTVPTLGNMASALGTGQQADVVGGLREPPGTSPRLITSFPFPSLISTACALPEQQKHVDASANKLLHQK
jgi:hypothetical protein